MTSKTGPVPCAAALALIIPALASCGGGGESALDGICAPIAGGASQLTTDPAPTATFGNAQAIFDGDLRSFGTLDTVGGTGTSSVRGTAQPGVVVPARMIAGVALSGTRSNVTLTITTYLGGVQQNAGPAVTTVERDGFGFYGIMTTGPYDAIEATFNLVGDTSAITLYELCVHEPF